MKISILTVLLVLFVGTNAFAGDYNYISAEKVKDNMMAGTEQIIVDIQVEDEYAQHHLQGSTPTYSYPVKTAGERAKIDAVIKRCKETEQPVVVVCPRGAGGAKRCYDYMASQDVDKDKLFILENGIAGWPYKELLQDI